MEGVDLVVGAHLFADVEAGKIAVPVGPLAASADEFTVEIRGRGGHAAAPHEAADPIVAAAEAILSLQHVVSRNVDPIESAVVSVTQINAGTARNIIPEAVQLAGTVRTFDPEVRRSVREAMDRVLRGVSEAHGATYEFAYNEGYDAVINDAEAAALVRGRRSRRARRGGDRAPASDHGRRGFLRLPDCGARGVLHRRCRAARARSRTTIRGSRSTRRPSPAASPCSFVPRSTTWPDEPAQPCLAVQVTEVPVQS